MKTTSVAIYQDLADIETGYSKYRATGYSGRPNYQGAFLEHLTGGRRLLGAFAYASVDPRRSRQLSLYMERIWEYGWQVRVVAGRIVGKTHRCDTVMQMAIDALEFCWERHPDVVVLCSSSLEILPLFRVLRDTRAMVELAAFKSAGGAADLVGPGKAVGTGEFVDLDRYVDERLSPIPERPAYGTSVDVVSLDGGFPVEQAAFLAGRESSQQTKRR
jgi:hypothetical protein